MDPMITNNKKPVPKERVTIDELVDKKLKDEAEKTVEKDNGPIKAKPKKVNFFQKKKKDIKSITKKPKMLIIAAVAVIVIVAAGLLTFYLTAPVHITKIETLRAISSRVENPPVQSEFTLTDPIMLYFEFDGAKVNTAVKFEVKDQEGSVVKSGSTTVLRQNSEDDANGKRYASLVSTSNTALAAGSYRVVLTMDSREVGAIDFVVIE